MAGEYSSGIRFFWGDLALSGDLRLIAGERNINNSGFTLNYTRKTLSISGELRPLLRIGSVRLSPSLSVKGQTLGLLSYYEMAYYHLPSYSEDLLRYEVSPYIKGNLFPISYSFDVGYRGREYRLSPIKSYTTYYAHGIVSLNFETYIFRHRFKVEGELRRNNYIGLKSSDTIPLGIDERSLFEYTPSIFDMFTLTFSVSRTLDLYTANLKDRSSVYRNILVGGEMRLTGWEIYLKRRREDQVFLHGSRSSDTRELVRYVLGIYRSLEQITLSSEISALYTLYRFKEGENSLYRYLDSDITYRGRSEIDLKVRLWDRGRYVKDSSLYYRLVKGVEVYSSGWVPVVTLGGVSVGASYEIKPDGKAVGIRSVFSGGEVFAMRRYDKGKLFWNMSIKFSYNF